MISELGPKRSIRGGLILTEARRWGLGNVSGTTVEVLAIVAKSEAERWLAQFGNPE